MNRREGITGLLMLIVLMMPWMLHAQGVAEFFGGGEKYTTGVVYKQGLVIDEDSPTGQPGFALYDEQSGDYIEPLAYPGAQGEPYFIGNRTDYQASGQAYVDFLESLTQEQRDATDVLSSEAYNALPDRGYEKGSLLAGTRSVLVYDPEKLDATVQLNAKAGLLLFQSRFDLNELEDASAVRERSLLFSAQGTLAARSNDTIGYRVAYIKPDDKSDENERTRRYEPGDELVAPVTNATVSTALNFNGQFPTDSKGRYKAWYYITPCPGFSYIYDIPINVSIPYRTYNPQSKRRFGEYLFWGLSGYVCSAPPFAPNPGLGLVGASDYINALGIHASQSHVPSPANVVIDVTLISGRFEVVDENRNAIPVGDTTRRTTPPEKEADESDYQTPEARDYNGDESDDHVSELGALTDQFIQDVTDEDREKLYGVWFSKPEDAIEGEGGVLFDAEDEPIAPDLVRVADRVPNFEPIGLLEQISKEDMLETDLYVFRESTGELVVEKKHFAKSGDRQESAINGVDADSGQGYFELTIPGGDGANSFRSLYRNRSLYKSYEDWQASLGIQDSITGHKSDSLRVGEPLTLVVINRATGYLGTASTSVLKVTDRSMNIELPEIKLYPPNLKIQVERQYEVDKGLTAGESRNYRVGSEGAALTSDQYVAIHTQWVDHDGTALPSELPGFTGRLVHLVADSTLKSDSRSDHFSIEPGKHTELLSLPNPAASATAAHQYVHVVGREINAMPDSPDFSVDAKGEFPMRPTKFVPVKVAIYDEQASVELQKTQKTLELSGVKQGSSVYRWVYRPEMQYSVFELDVEQIKSVRTDDNGGEQQRDLTEAPTPVIAGNDDALRVKQTLLGSEYNPLTLFGSDESLLVSLEGFEQSVDAARLGESSKPWHFSDLGHLGELDSDDFLSLNLLKNSDAGNVLWEWAFEYLTLDTQFASLDTSEIQPIFISADETQIPLQAELIGYDKRAEDKKVPVRVTWSYSGVGRFDERLQVLQDNGMAFNTFDVSTRSGSRSKLSINLTDDIDLKSTIGEFITIPGVPVVVNTTTKGDAYVQGGGPMIVDVLVKDAHGNTVADGTSVNISVQGSAILNDYNAGTVNGRVQAEVRGGMFAGDYEFNVTVQGELTQSHEFTVKPYTVTISDLPSQVRLGQSGVFTLKARDEKGRPAPAGMAFQVFAQGLMINQESAVTDEQGSAQIAYQAGFSPTDISVRASLGYTDAVTQSVSITNQNANTDSPVSVEPQILVGDRRSSGAIEYERYDGVGLELPFATSLAVDLSGTPNSTISLTLGTPDRPNVTPIVAYTMSDEGDASTNPLGIDAVGRHNATAKASGVLSDADGLSAPARVNHYRGQAGDSAVFDGKHYLEAEVPSELISKDSVAVRLDAFIDTDSKGELLSLGEDGLLSLSMSENQTLRLQINTAVVQSSSDMAPAHTLTTRALSEGWHSVAAVLSEGQLVLYVDGIEEQRVSLTQLNIPTPSIVVREPTMTLAMGHRFVGALDNVELYNPNADALLQFGDTDGALSGTSQTLEVTFDATGTQRVTVHSTGQLNSQAASALVNRSIVILSDVGTQDYINLLSMDSYTALAGVYATTLYEGAELPAIDPDGLDSAAWRPAHPAGKAVAAVGSYLVTPAHAFFGLNRKRFLSGLSSLASLVLPINEIKEIWVQMGYLATDPDKFEAGELVINIISLATYFPALRPLQPVLKPLKRFYKRYGDKPYTKAAGGVLGDAFEQLFKNRKADKLLAVVPYLLTVAEMVKNPEAVTIMVEAIQSSEDFWAWINYFNLPAEGWGGEGGPPLVAQLDHETGEKTQVGRLPSWLGFMISDAVASRARGTRVKGEIRGRAIVRALGSLGDNFFPKDLSASMRGIAQGLKSLDAEDLRKLANTETLLAGTTVLAREGQKNMQNFFKGRTTARIKPPMVLAMIAYLQSEMRINGKLSDKTLQKEVYKLIGQAFSDIATNSLDEENPPKDLKITAAKSAQKLDSSYLHYSSGAHGALFHLAAIAYFTALPSETIVGIEKTRNVYVTDDASPNTNPVNDKNHKTGFVRRVDIILSANNSSGEHWVELKSLRQWGDGERKVSAIAGDGLKTYGGTNNPAQIRFPTAARHIKNEIYRKSGYSGQFHVDRFALANGAYTTIKDGTGSKRFPVKVADFSWYLQDFQTRKIRTAGKSIKSTQSPSLGNINSVSVVERLTDASKGGTKKITKGIMKATLKIEKGEQSFAVRQSMANRIDLFNTLTLLRKQLKINGKLETEIEAALIEAGT